MQKSLVEKNFGLLSSCFVGFGVWWFLTSQPSSFEMMLAAFIVGHLFLGYLLLAVLLPEPVEPTEQPSFAPIPQAEVSRPKALTV